MLKYYVADAFTDHIFEGNPAGVCIMNAWPSEEKMSRIAIENNLSETAFAVKEDEDTYGIRWFTPGGEIDLCGHATLATAYILFRFYEQKLNLLQFCTKKSAHHLMVKKNGELLMMDFPTIEPVPFEYAEYMTEAMGAKPEEVYRTERDLMLVYDSEETVQNLKPDFDKIRKFPVGKSVYVTARGRSCDYVGRAFWPKININEDPVCGAMYCTLIPFWYKRMEKKKTIARQLSARTGTIYCEYHGDRVTISGHCALYAEGNICVDE